MKVLLAVTALGLCTMAPGISACEYDDATSASATPPAQVGLAPAASKAPATSVVKARVQMAAAKQQATKSKPANDKVAAASPQ